jgi:hypothetical protein
MNIRAKNSETIISIPNTVSFTYLQDFLDYINIKTIVSKSKATQKEITKISEDSQKAWWKNNKAKFVK